MCHLTISAVLNVTRPGFLGTRRHPAGFLGAREESLAPNCILANFKARSSSTDRRIPHQAAGFFRIPRHPKAPDGTQQDSSAPVWNLWHPTASKRSSQLRAPQPTAGFHIRRQDSSGFHGTRQHSTEFFAPCNILVARYFRRRPEIQAEFIFASPIPRRPRLSAETRNSCRIHFRLTDSSSPETDVDIAIFDKLSLNYIKPKWDKHQQQLALAILYRNI